MIAPTPTTSTLAPLSCETWGEKSKVALGKPIGSLAIATPDFSNTVFMISVPTILDTNSSLAYSIAPVSAAKPKDLTLFINLVNCRNSLSVSRNA